MDLFRPEKLRLIVCFSFILIVIFPSCTNWKQKVFFSSAKKNAITRRLLLLLLNNEVKIDKLELGLTQAETVSLEPGLIRAELENIMWSQKI